MTMASVTATFPETSASPRTTNQEWAGPHIVFDMDGILLDSEPIYIATEGALLREIAGPDADIMSIFPRLLGRTSRDSAIITLEAFGIDMDVDAYLARRNALLVKACSAVPLLPGVERFVRAMRARGVRMSIATSSPRILLEAKKVGKDDFFALFEGIVCGDDVTNGKPDPEIFLAGAELIGQDPSNCIVFEDAPSGVKGAKAAGMKCVALPNHDVDRQLYVEAGFDWEISSFETITPQDFGLPGF